MSEPTDTPRRPAPEPEPERPAKAVPNPAQSPPPPPRRWFWLVPAATFLVGVLLGGAVVAAGAAGDDEEPVAGGFATATAPAPTASVARTVIIPVSCEQALDRSRTGLSTAGQAVEALRDFDTGRLQELLDQMQDAQRDVERLTEQCRTEAREQN